MEDSLCKICSYKTKKISITLPFFRHIDFKKDLNNIVLRKCMNCQMIHNYKNSDNIANLFKKKSYSLSKQTSHLVKNNKDYKRRTFYQAEIIYKIFRKKNNINVLDIGCFDGQLLLDMSKLFKKYNFFGYDINKKLIKLFPKKKNFKFVLSNLKNLNFKFDLIIMSHSIMYIEDLNNKLQICKELLNKRGRIFIQFPNLKINPFYCLMSDQFQYPTENSIKNILKFNNFDTKIIKNRIFSRELIILAKVGNHKKYKKLFKDYIFEEAINKIKKIKQNLLKISEIQLNVLGTTVNAAFVDEILSKKIIFFIDEQKFKINNLFRGKKVIHPKKLINKDVTILPYGEKNKFILDNFKKQYKGNYYLI